MATVCVTLLICAGLMPSAQEELDRVRGLAQGSAMSQARHAMQRARTRSHARPYLDDLEKSYRKFIEYQDEYADRLPEGREDILEAINWRESYRQIERMSHEATLEEVKRLFLEKPRARQDLDVSAFSDSMTCMTMLRGHLMLSGPLVWFRTSEINIYVNHQWGGPGIMWLMCERETDRFLRAPTDESGCSAGSVYRGLRFKTYIRREVPFIEAKEGGCRGDDAPYEALYDLKREVRDVPGSVRRPRVHRFFDQNKDLYMWDIPDFDGYEGFRSESWSSRGERRWARREAVQIEARGKYERDRECMDEDENPYKHLCKNERLPDPMWERRCRLGRTSREVTCSRKLIARALAEPFFSRYDYVHSNGDKDIDKFYKLRLDGVDELRDLGYVIPKKSIEEMRTRYEELTGTPHRARVE